MISYWLAPEAKLVFTHEDHLRKYFNLFIGDELESERDFNKDITEEEIQKWEEYFTSWSREIVLMKQKEHCG